MAAGNEEEKLSHENLSQRYREAYNQKEYTPVQNTALYAQLPVHYQKHNTIQLSKAHSQVTNLQPMTYNQQVQNTGHAIFQANPLHVSVKHDARYDGASPQPKEEARFYDPGNHRRRVVNIKYYQNDPYQGKLPWGEGWVIEPIDGGFRAIKDERAVNGWMHIYERAKVIDPSGNSGKTYWYFESIFDPPERNRHIKENYSPEGTSVEDLTPQSSGYYSHIKFDYAHARRVWKEILPIIPTKDETMREIAEQQRREKIRQMQGHRQAYASQHHNREPYASNGIRGIYEQRPEPKMYSGQDQRLQYAHRTNPQNLHTNIQYQAAQHPVQENQYTHQGYDQATGYVRHVEPTAINEYQEAEQENDGTYTDIDESKYNVPYPKYLDLTHLFRDLQESKQNTVPQGTVSSADEHSDRKHAYYDRSQKQDLHISKTSHPDVKHLYKGQRENPYQSDSKMPIYSQRSYNTDGSDVLQVDQGRKKNMAKPGEVWVLRIYGFGYSNNDIKPDDLLHYDEESHVSDNKKTYQKYIDAYDKNAVNIAYGDKSMSKPQLEGVIGEIIDFIISNRQSDTASNHGFYSAQNSGIVQNDITPDVQKNNDTNKNSYYSIHEMQLQHPGYRLQYSGQHIKQKNDQNTAAKDNNPYGVMYLRRKTVTIEESPDGTKRSHSDITEAKAFKRGRQYKHPYLDLLPIPQEIKHNIGKRSLSSFISAFNEEDLIEAYVDHCKAPADSGPCRARMTKWAYDVGKRKCFPFVYGGCGGNSNRYDSREECLHKCASPKRRMSKLSS